MMSHDFCRAKIGEYLDQTLEENQREAVAAHLESCAACAQIARQTAGIRATLRQIKPVEAPAQLRQNVRAALQNERTAQQTTPQERRRFPVFTLRVPQLAWSGSLAVAAIALMVIARPFANAPLGDLATAKTPQNSPAPRTTPRSKSRAIPFPQAPLSRYKASKAPALPRPASRTGDFSTAPTRAEKQGQEKPALEEPLSGPQAQQSPNRHAETSQQNDARARVNDFSAPDALSQSGKTPLRHSEQIASQAVKTPFSTDARRTNAPRATRSTNGIASPPPASAPAPESPQATLSQTPIRSDAAPAIDADSMKVRRSPGAPPTDFAARAPATPIFKSRIFARAAAPRPVPDSPTSQNASAKPQTMSREMPKNQVRHQQPVVDLSGTLGTAFSIQLKAAPASSTAPALPNNQAALAPSINTPQSVAPSATTAQARGDLLAPASPRPAPARKMVPSGAGRSSGAGASNADTEGTIPGNAGLGRRNRAALAAPSRDFALGAKSVGDAALPIAVRRFELQIQVPRRLENVQIRLTIPLPLRLRWPITNLIWSGDLASQTSLDIPFSLAMARGGEKITVMVEQKNVGAPSKVLETRTLIVPAL